MNKKIKKKDEFDFQEYLAGKLENLTFRKHYDEYGKQLEIAYRILKLRKNEGLSQAELAKKIGTSQSNIARMEAGEQNLTTETLYKVASALGRELRIDFVR